MGKRKNNALAISIAAALVLAIIVTAGYLYYHNLTDTKKETAGTNNTPTTNNQPSTANKATDLTNSQIFEHVSSQLGLTRDKLAYFRIFGQDKVQYSNGKGATYVYKISDVWKVAQEDAQSIAMCSDLSQVPESYRPPCSESNSTSSATLYLDTSGRSINYPPSSMVSYIGE